MARNSNYDKLPYRDLLAGCGSQNPANLNLFEHSFGEHVKLAEAQVKAVITEAIQVVFGEHPELDQPSRVEIQTWGEQVHQCLFDEAWAARWKYSAMRWVRPGYLPALVRKWLTNTAIRQGLIDAPLIPRPYSTAA